MNHKKSMHIFWLSLSLLLAAGVIVLVAAQFYTHKKEEARQEALQEKNSIANAENTKATANTVYNTTVPAGLNSKDTRNITEQPVQQTNGDAADYLYELKIQNGYLEVYYYHTQRLFLNTGIPDHMLTAVQKQELQKGKYFKDEKELYGYLESCSS